MNIDKTHKKLNLKNRYLDFELEEVSALFIIYQKKFNSRIRQLAMENNIPLDLPSTPPSSPCCNQKEEIPCNVNKKKFKNEEDLEIFKVLYRKIAKKTHPDKTHNNEASEKILKEATQAKDEQDLFTIFDICDDLDIEMPKITKRHIKLLEDAIKDKEREIIKIKCSDPWIWHEAVEVLRIQIEQKILEFLASS
mgnify:CR=1 FL=1